VFLLPHGPLLAGSGGRSGTRCPLRRKRIRAIAGQQATARATSNIALVKYWGKRDVALNLPSTGSISLTLDRLATETSVHFDPGLNADVFELNGAPAGAKGARVERFLDLVRTHAGIETRAQVRSRNDFPTGAGLASSASGFAALALACDAALELGLSLPELSVLARRGSGSAARSLLGGFAEMRPGSAPDGHDAFAVALAAPDHVPIRLVVALTTLEEKDIGSTEGMQRSEATSPFHAAWLASVPNDLADMRAAIAAADLERIGTLAESSCLRMHAVMMGARPPLLYWNASTLGAMHAVRDLRKQGTGAWFTIDAGPQVKVLCDTADLATVESALRSIDGVHGLISAAPGAGAQVLS
jgi:diphosphomevalonate decarboxylase